MKKGTNDLVFLKERGAEITSDQEIAQHMNAYFTSVFTHNKRLRDYDYVLDYNLCNASCTPSEVEIILKT